MEAPESRSEYERELALSMTEARRVLREAGYGPSNLNDSDLAPLQTQLARALFYGRQLVKKKGGTPIPYTEVSRRSSRMAANIPAPGTKDREYSPGSVGQLCAILTNAAKRFSAQAPAQVLRDEHMHHYEGPMLLREITDAVIVAFCNTVAREQGADLGLYSSDINPGNAR